MIEIKQEKNIMPQKISSAPIVSDSNHLPIKLKMKSYLLIFLSLAFSISLILFSVFEVQQTQAQKNMGINDLQEASSEGNLSKNESSTSANVDQIKIEKIEVIDYYMAYPGILPDHPLYWLKMLRDRLLLALTRDPVQRFEKLLLYADKRLGAAKVLIEGSKVQLGVTTATKGEKYLEQAVNQYFELKESGKVDLKLEQKLLNANLKHQQILEQTLNKIPDQAKNAINKEIEKIKANLERLKS
ncbi:DUF5667 domain-containing protein [Patescibacteria group bacterium]